MIDREVVGENACIPGRPGLRRREERSNCPGKHARTVHELHRVEQLEHQEGRAVPCAPDAGVTAVWGGINREVGERCSWREAAISAGARQIFGRHEKKNR